MKDQYLYTTHYINWIATYRAALTGLYANVAFSAVEMDELAARAADLRHGPLPNEMSLKSNSVSVLQPVDPQKPDLSSE